jgi:putative transposase
VLLSLLYQSIRALFSLLTVIVRSDLSTKVELLVLRHENQVLRRQVQGRTRWDPADRLWLAALSRLLPRRRWADVFPITPATLLRWHRHLVSHKWTYADRRRPGRPGMSPSIKIRIVRMARENPTWGHKRVRREALVDRVGVRDRAPRGAVTGIGCEAIDARIGICPPVQLLAPPTGKTMRQPIGDS